ncbi:hypothetical protein HRG_012796 [Hirsutella rhossiliensis]
MSNSRSSERGSKDGKKRKDKGKQKASKSRSSRSRGTYTSIVTTAGAGTAEDPSIAWYIGRPRKGVGEMYEQMIRDAAKTTGMGVWSLAHDTTSLGGADVRDDMHITVFADVEPGGSLSEDFDFEGHLYITLDENGLPWRLLHPEEFEFDSSAAPVILYDANQTPLPYYLGDEYYEYYENAASHKEEATQVEAGEGASQGKTKRKRRPRKGKAKADKGSKA